MPRVIVKLWPGKSEEQKARGQNRKLINLVWKGKLSPGEVFDLTLPLDQVAEGYRAMDKRRAIKALLRP